MSRQGQGPPLPNQYGRDEEEASSQEEGEAFHEVQSGWVERVEDTRGHQHGQAVHTGHRRKESTWKGIDTVLQSWKNPGSRWGGAVPAHTYVTWARHLASLTRASYSVLW